MQPLELRSGVLYAGKYPLSDGKYSAPSGSFIPTQTILLPETVLGLESWSNDLDMKKIKEKGKNFWQNVKRRLSKTD